MINRLIKLVISAVYFFFHRAGRLFLRLFGMRTPDTLVVVSYHSVKPWQRDRFAKQMDEVLKTGKPVFADIGGTDCRKGTHHIAVTFDDGFGNFMENALPIMAEKRIPAIIFVPAGYVGGYPGWIKNPDHENAREILMTADELRSLPADLVKIGSHCVTHPRLTSLDKEQIVHELSGSKEQLESLLGRDVRTLAFPYDDYNDEIVELVRKAGYLRVFTDLPGYPISKIDVFLAGRTSVSPDDWGNEYWLKLIGAYQWLPLAVTVKNMLFKKER